MLPVVILAGDMLADLSPFHFVRPAERGGVWALTAGRWDSEGTTLLAFCGEGEKGRGLAESAARLIYCASGGKRQGTAGLRGDTILPTEAQQAAWGLSAANAGPSTVRPTPQKPDDGAPALPPLTRPLVLRLQIVSGDEKFVRRLEGRRVDRVEFEVDNGKLMRGVALIVEPPG
jgi:hypothetical protein